MRSLRILLAAACASAALGAHAQAPAAAGKADAGKNKIYQCQGCHGIADWKTAFPEVYRVPKLGGQKAAYIVAALKAYKTGERDFPTMRAMVSDLTDQDMADIAAYYAADAIATAAAPTTEAKSEAKK
jgi:cytochrome c553